MAWKVEVHSFKISGKYAYDHSYQTEHDNILDIFNEVIELQKAGALPGVIPSSWQTDWILSIRIPGHPLDHPRLIIPSHYYNAMKQVQS